MRSNASQHVEIAKELHAKIALMTKKNLNKTQTLIHSTLRGARAPWPLYREPAGHAAG